MSTATTSAIRPDRLRARRELAGELAHVRNLVVLRDLLRARGATPAELREYEAAIAQARSRLAGAARRASAGYAAAA